MENQLNNIRACWKMTLRCAREADEAFRCAKDNKAYEELSAEANNYYSRYLDLCEAFVRKYGGYIHLGR